MSYRDSYIARHCSPKASLESMRAPAFRVTNPEDRAKRLTRSYCHWTAPTLTILPGVNVKRALA